MQTLPTQLKHSGYTLTQVERGPQWAIYRKAKNGYHNDHFEVIRVFTMPAGVMPSGAVMEEREVYPKSEDWGTNAFSVKTLQDAHKKIQGWGFK